MRILIVEDDPMLADIIRRNLKVRGHAASVAGSAESAILQMIEEWPDVLILDVNLPDYSGWEILRRIGEESRRRLRVVMISAAPISRKRIEEFKPAAALQKPFPIYSLLHAVEEDREPAAARGS